MLGTIYVKDDQTVLMDDCNRFIYEVFVFVRFENIFSTANHKYFYCNKEILNIVRSYNSSPYIEVTCDLYSAPLSWLIENEYSLYIKPEKKKKNSNNKNNEQKDILIE